MSITGDDTHSRFEQWRLPDRGSWLVHGHLHSGRQLAERCIHVGLDAWGLALVSINKIAVLIDAAEAGEQASSPPGTYDGSSRAPTSLPEMQRQGNRVLVEALARLREQGEHLAAPAEAEMAEMSASSLYRICRDMGFQSGNAVYRGTRAARTRSPANCFAEFKEARVGQDFIGPSRWR